MSKRLILPIAAIAFALALPLSVAAGPTIHHEGSWKLADGNTATLTRLNFSSPSGQGGGGRGVTPATQGYWNSGCYYAVTNALGNVIYSYTIWQTFGSNGSYINYLPAPSHSSTSDLGWVLTSASDTHWWINTSHQDAAARGSWTFTQYVNGSVYRTASGWVQVQDNYRGTWSCYSS